MHTIIWDWNGTLLNDLDFCISTINVLLKNRQLNLLDHYSYKEVFSFPVKDCYESLGFDFSKEDFSISAQEYMDIYNAGVSQCKLHAGAIDVLQHFKSLGLQQFVLSAMQQNMLEQTLKHQNIFDYFEGVAGLNDHYASSKIERGKQFISEFNINKSQATIIGDTNHDFEVAQQLEIDCILVADGHQSKQRLVATGARVIEELPQLKSLLP
ncbi:HAD family hydrolase [Draconibacterium halophilum]|uniref:phosphoglycolate phosphatase n=1 Tax=Draconibacterium halophilum TaxID=2706887 RepID=A0A6C0RAN8_9BACT|nr:HAD hydrolase-like protein [Draconibacterium halophilum]QIA07022.1 HAD family hydrolase [Draconibacterium halophilum]